MVKTIFGHAPLPSQGSPSSHTAAAQSDYTFDLAGRLTNLIYSQGTIIITNYRWYYDAANRINSYVLAHTGLEENDYTQIYCWFSVISDLREGLETP